MNKLKIQRTVDKGCMAANNLDKEKILKFLKDNKVNSMLDTGCGDGKFTSDVAKLLKCTNVVGIEIEENAVKSAEDKGIIILKTDLNNDIKLKKESFDLILSIQNIEHLYFTDHYLEEMKRLMKKDGYFIITTTNLAGLHYRIMLLLGWQPICLHPSIYQTFPLKNKNPLYGHHSVFTHNGLKEVLKKHNFVIEKHYSHTIYFMPKIISEVLCKIFPNWGTFSCFILRKK